MVKQKKTKEENYEQLSLFEFLSAESDGMGKNNTENFKGSEFSVLWRIGNEKQTNPTGERFSGRNSNNQQYISTRGIDEDTAKEQSKFFRESELYRDNREDDKRSDNGMDSSTTAISISQNSFFHLNNELENSLSIREKYNNNMSAIEVLQNIIHEQRRATYQEKEVLVKYTGWGGCSQVFDENNLKWINERKRLKNLISIREYNNAKASTLTSFYTPFAIIDNIYRIVDKLGFKNGKILEPSCGTGHFFGRMPPDMMEQSVCVGIELDSITGNIAKILYENSDIYIQGFEDIHFAKGGFDLVISNIPFGRYKVFDKEYNQENFDIHNYFIAKSLSMIRNGGLIAFITSTETLDGNNHIREFINQRANFLGAIRLPSNVFMQNGGNTHVSADIIFLQRDDDRLINENEEFLDRDYHKLTPNKKINRYFINHPEMVLGELSERKNKFGSYEIIVNERSYNIDETVGDNHSKYEQEFNKILPFFSEVYEPVNDIVVENKDVLEGIEIERYKANTYFIKNDELYFKDISIATKVDLNDKAKQRIIGQIKIAEAVERVIDDQVNNVADNIYIKHRHELNMLYDEYIIKFGYLNATANTRVFKDDVRSSLLKALEKIESETKTAKKEDIFYKRTVKPRIEIKSVDTIEEAMNVSLNMTGEINLDYMSSIYNKNTELIRDELIKQELAYIDPISKKLLKASEYLSGNVRKKLNIAVAHGYEKNISALKSVLPPKINAEDIKCQLGATWIDDKYVQQFVKEIFNTPNYKIFGLTYDKILGFWIIEKYATYNDPEIDYTWNVAKTDEISIIGTDGEYHTISQPTFNGWDILDCALNSKTPNVYNYWFENDYEGKEIRKRKLNVERTTEARMLVEQMQMRFSEWIFEDIERRTNLVEKYNELFNSIRLQEYDGSYLTFPEMSELYKLENYQKNAVARIMTSNQNTLLSQRVGAGKTFEMIAAGMEMIRLGIRNKLLYVVPNHLVEQWGSDFLKLYPNAKVLIADKKDFQKSKRQLFIHKIATGDYDAIIMAHSSFSLIPVSNETLISGMNHEIEILQQAIENANYEDKINYFGSNRRKQVKQLEKTKKAIENNIKKLTDTRRDEGITFEQLGIDYMFVDEAHKFKNLYIYSSRQNIAGIPNAKSKKASDMLLKTQWLQKNNGRICFATGTPISNTMAELYVLQKYLQSDMLEEMNIHCFDAWAKNFGEVTTSFEISIDGNSFKSKERFCKFFNIQELVTIFKCVAEIQTESMLRKELLNSTTGRKYAVPPRHLEGKPTIIAIEPTTELIDYMENIVKRANAVYNGEVDSRVDNMLKITNDSKKASIDLRLTNDGYLYTGHGNSKLDIIAKQIVKVYNDFDNDKATQLVFCDSSTPNKGKFNVYDELKRILILYGIDENEIAFIHDYDSMKAKQMLFNEVNSGNVRILFGSTEKLGEGTNVQRRMIAVHHVDVPWKASDIEQRNGRAFRQGNMYKEIYEFRYVTKKSFDAYSWQMIETKAFYQKQIIDGTTSTREMEEDNKAFFSYSEIKAIASDNPLIKKKFEIDNEIRRLETLRKQWQKKVFTAQEDKRTLPHDIELFEKQIAILEKDAKIVNQNIISLEDISTKFRIELMGNVYKDMKIAGNFMQELIKNNKTTNNMMIGKFCGFDLNLEYNMNNGWVINLYGSKKYIVDIINVIGRTNFERMIRVLNKIPNQLNIYKERLKNATNNLISANTIIDTEFPDKDKLIQLKMEQKRINQKLSLNKDDIKAKSEDIIIEQDYSELEM